MCKYGMILFGIGQRLGRVNLAKTRELFNSVRVHQGTVHSVDRVCTGVDHGYPGRQWSVSLQLHFLTLSFCS